MTCSILGNGPIFIWQILPGQIQKLRGQIQIFPGQIQIFPGQIQIFHGQIQILPGQIQIDEHKVSASSGAGETGVCCYNLSTLIKIIACIRGKYSTLV